ncbi:hypothetical protein O9929_08600 [Vibrio lentus]|nr:hypothetical protein [Vibrio lentus]
MQGITRIVDHGVRCVVEDDDLMEQLIAKRTPLTVCPLSNDTKLKVFDTMQQRNINETLKKGAVRHHQFDDPAYFGGYMNDNFLAVARYSPTDEKRVGAIQHQCH